MANDFWKRLDLAIKATTASREGRMTELQALEADPDSFVQEGLAKFTPYAWWERTPYNYWERQIWWKTAYLSGNRDSLKLSCPAGIFTEKQDFIFPRNAVRRLSRFKGLYMALHIEHTQAGFPDNILFYPSLVPWASGFEKLRLNLVRLGYDIEY